MTDKIYTDTQSWYWQTSLISTNKVDINKQGWYQQPRLISTSKVDTDRQGLNWQTRFTLTRLILAGHTKIFKQCHVNSAVRKYLCVDIKTKKWHFI